MFGPIAVFPKTVLSWRVLTPDDITEDSLCLFFLLQPKIDILVVGVGDRKNLDSVRKRVIPAVQKHRIGLELHTTVGFVIASAPTNACCLGRRYFDIQLSQRREPLRRSCTLPASRIHCDGR